MVPKFIEFCQICTVCHLKQDCNWPHKISSHIAHTSYFPPGLSDILEHNRIVGLGIEQGYPQAVMKLIKCEDVHSRSLSINSFIIHRIKLLPRKHDIIYLKVLTKINRNFSRQDKPKGPNQIKAPLF